MPASALCQVLSAVSHTPQIAEARADTACGVASAHTPFSISTAVLPSTRPRESTTFQRCSTSAGSGSQGSERFHTGTQVLAEFSEPAPDLHMATEISCPRITDINVVHQNCSWTRPRSFWSCLGQPKAKKRASYGARTHDCVINRL